MMNLSSISPKVDDEVFLPPLPSPPPPLEFFENDIREKMKFAYYVSHKRSPLPLSYFLRNES